MALRKSAVLFRPFAGGAALRNYSASTKLVNVSVNSDTGYATVTLQRPPVNSLNLELLTDLNEALTQLEKDKSRGAILASSSSTVFSSGLDIFEMYKPDPKRSKDFWSTLQSVWLNLYGSSYPTVAAINGHAPAGGCLLSLSCEYRIMLPKFTIGLNETQLGIIAPSWFKASMKNVIGTRHTELALTSGKLFTTDEALKIGLIDEVASDQADLLAKSEQFLKRFSRIPAQARKMSKLAVRGKDIADLQKNREGDLKTFLELVNTPLAQKSLEAYLQSLKKKA